MLKSCMSDLMLSFSLNQFYLEEAKGAVDYQGYISPRRGGQIVSVLILIFVPVEC